MKRTSLLLAVACAVLMVQAQSVKPMKQFVDELMARMTLQEKIGQLNLQVAGDIRWRGASQQVSSVACST